MIETSRVPGMTGPSRAGWWLLLASIVLTIAVYSSGLSGGYIFDDYPNIIDNHGVQPHDASVPSLVRAALSSPSSEFKRPLASLSFAVNYLASGLDPFWMKLTNLVIHLLNGLLVFLLARALLLSASKGNSTGTENQHRRVSMTAALIAGGWMLLPINLTGVLYVVQRMESMANLFVLLGLIGYVAGRRRMLQAVLANDDDIAHGRHSSTLRGLMLCVFSITVLTAVGILAKETAVMLPLYALLIEWMLFHFKTPTGTRDWRIFALFLLVLVLPAVFGLAWLLPSILKPETWAARDFTLRTRLLNEARIVADYIRWTLLPTPHALSFYHDDFHISTGLLTPWTTLGDIALLAGLTALMMWLRLRRPLVALGIALFFGCQLLTGTIIPLELIYEHRNYFASFGLLLAIVPLLAAPGKYSVAANGTSRKTLPGPSRARALMQPEEGLDQQDERAGISALPMALPRYTLLTGLMLCWTVLTALTAHAWGNPLRLAEDLAARAPQSPRAQYELGRTYIIYSRYDPASPFTRLAYAPLEKAASLPGSSILPEQALIFMNARMHLPLKDAWWVNLNAKLKAHKPTVQDESSLAALTQCAHEHHCDLPQDRMLDAFLMALTHPDPDARLLSDFSDYAWNVLNDRTLGQRTIEQAVLSDPDEPAYHVTLIKMLAAQGQMDQARNALRQLQSLNFGGRLDAQLAELRALPGMQ